MSLLEYRKKRDFHRTPEPVGRTGKDSVAGQFFVQRHNASRLHYDFRLAIEGVLKSWAVPKGPSMDPAEKRLAVQVEDHPLDYGNFEGNIPKGQYGGGSVMLWDRGQFGVDGDKDASAQWERGDIKLHLEGEKLRGGFKLFRMKGKPKGNEWLLVKTRDEFALGGPEVEAEARSVLTHRTQEEIADGVKPRRTGSVPKAEPMLPTLVRTLPEGDEWLYEVKWDGVRALCSVENGALDIRSRGGKQYNRSFPELMALPAHLKLHSALLDGEIVAMDASGQIRFSAIQPRLGIRFAKNGKGDAPLGISLYLFDILFADGGDLREKPLEHRKEVLAAALQVDDRFRLSPALDGTATELLEVAEEHRLEGIVAKRKDSPYRSGRSADWVKVKLGKRQEFVICGWLSGKRSTFASLVLGLFEGDELYWCGNVGTGFSESTQRSIREILEKDQRAPPPAFARGEWPDGMHWAKPTMVAEVRFAEWTRAGRLRSPVFVGIRQDKTPHECVREHPAEGEAMVEKQRATRDHQPTKPGVSQRPPLTHTDKIYFPADGISKGELLDYYEAVSGYMLPHLRGRPATLKRYPDGIDGPSFFQKNMPASTPDWVPTVTMPSESDGREIRYLLIEDLRTLLYAVNLGCIDIHTWMSRAATVESPDYVLFDLDPYECDFSKVVDTAKVLRELMQQLGLDAYAKTSGGNGIHVVTPLSKGQTFDEVREFTSGMAAAISKLRPDLITTERSLKKRPRGKVYFDYVQFGRGKTIASVYSVRPRNGAPVSTPLEWEELTGKLKPSAFHLRNTIKRVQGRGDLWKKVLDTGQSLRTARKKLERL